MFRTRTSICTRRFVALLVASVAMTAALTAPRTAAAQTFTVTRLAPPSGFVDSRAYAVNDNGLVVGNIYSRRDMGGTMKAALWQGGQYKPLHTDSRWAESAVSEINNQGLVVGGAWEAGTNIQHAMLWKGVGPTTTQMVSLNDLPGVKSSGYFLQSAGGINDQGQIPARAFLPSDNPAGGQGKSVVCQLNETRTDVTSVIALYGGTPGAANEINAYGVVSGQKTVGTNPDGSVIIDAFRHDPVYSTEGVVVDYVATKMEGLSGSTSTFTSVLNDVGAFAGTSRYPVFWSSSEEFPVQLGRLTDTGYALYALNNSNWCVGSHTTTADRRAVLWNLGVSFAQIDLNSRKAGGDTKLWLTFAHDVNKNGLIVGLSSGRPNLAFLLTPR